MEIYEEAQWQIQKPQMGQELRLINRMQGFFALELNRYCVVDNKICPKATI